MKSDLVEIPCDVIGETSNAVRIADGKIRVWLPKSQMEIQHNGQGTVAVMPEWLAKEKELI
jgi:RNase P/RNase MRP subunit p29